MRCERVMELISYRTRDEGKNITLLLHTLSFYDRSHIYSHVRSTWLTSGEESSLGLTQGKSAGTRSTSKTTCLPCWHLTTGQDSPFWWFITKVLLCALVSGCREAAHTQPRQRLHFSSQCRKQINLRRRGWDSGFMRNRRSGLNVTPSDFLPMAPLKL